MIDISTLKKKVLSLAFQGKLTEQLPSDLGVDQIIDKCREDKQRSIAEGKYKSEEFRGSISTTCLKLEIPYNWQYMFISDVALFQEGPGIMAVDFRTEGVPLIRIAGMNGKVVTLKGCNYLDPKMVEEKWKHFKLDVGDVVISSSASLDRIAEVDDEAAGSIPYTGLIRFKMYGGIDKEYFKWFLKSPYYIEQVNRQKKGGFIQHYGPSHLRKMIIPIPPLEEQGRISEKLNQIFRYIEVVEELQSEYCSNLEKLKCKVIDAGIHGKLTEQLPEDGYAEDLYNQIQDEKTKLIKEGKIKKEKPLPDISEDEIPFEIPKNWKWVRLSDVIDVRDGTHDSPQYQEEGVPLITSKNLSTGVLDFDNVKYISELDADKINERSSVDDGDILFAMIGTIGNPVIVRKRKEFCIKNVALFKKYEKTDILIEYLYWFLMLEQYEFKKIVSGGLQPFISLKQFRLHLMPLPPLSEQKRIVEKIDALLNVFN